MRLSLALIVSVLALVALPAPAEASPYVRHGVRDDAWLAAGPGTLDDRLNELSSLGVEVYRFTLLWDQVERRNNVYDWSWPDAVIRGLRAHGIAPVVTIWGSPRWANGGRSANYAPRSKWSLSGFAAAAAARGEAKPVYRAFRLPLAQASRDGTHTIVWGQVRPRNGRQPYRLQQWRSGGWRWVGSQRTTGTRGFLSRTIEAGKGARLRIWSPRDGTFSPVLSVR